MSGQFDVSPVGESRGPLAVIVGVGLVGSWVARLLKECDLVLIDPDIVEPGTRRAEAFKAAPVGIAKVTWLAAAAEHQRVLPLQLPVQRLGEGFWKWLWRRCQPVVMVDCADASSAHSALARVQRKLLPVPIIQTGIQGNEGTVRRFDPAPQAACWSCLGMVPNDRRNSCLSGALAVNDAQAPATRATMEIARFSAEKAAEWVGREIAKTALSPGCSVEIRLAPEQKEQNLLVESQLLRSPQCDHNFTSDETSVISLCSYSSAMPMAELFAAASSLLGGVPVQLRTSVTIAPGAACMNCGWQRRQPLAIGTGARYLCGRCGSSEIFADDQTLKRELVSEEVNGMTPAELGLPLWSRLTFVPLNAVHDNREQQVVIELEGDARELVGEDYE